MQPKNARRRCLRCRRLRRLLVVVELVPRASTAGFWSDQHPFELMGVKLKT